SKIARKIVWLPTALHLGLSNDGHPPPNPPAQRRVNHMNAKTRRNLSVAALALAVSGLVIWQFVRPKQIVYQGKTLNAWLDELVATKGNSTQAITAFRATGPKAIPFLTNVLTSASPLRDGAVRIKSSLNSPTLYRTLPSWRYN